MNYQHVRNRIYIRLKIYTYGWKCRGPIRKKQLQKATLRYYDSEYWKHMVDKMALKLVGLKK